MAADVLNKPRSKRFIATALLAEGCEESCETLNAPINPVVCVGEVVEHARLPDGRYNVVLLGRWRARVISEATDGDYRIAEVDLISDRLARFTAFAEETLTGLETLVQSAVRCGLIDSKLFRWVTEISTSSRQLSDLMTFYFLPPEECEIKQTILEEPDVLARFEILMERLREMIADRCPDAPPTTDAQEGAAPAWPPTGGNN